MRNSRKVLPKTKKELEKELIESEVSQNKELVHLQLIAQIQLLLGTLDSNESKISFIKRFIEDTQDEFTIKKLRSYKKAPVSISEFVESRYYLNMPRVMYPKVLDALEELNSGDYVEGVLTGAIGTGKTTIALITTAYQLYLLSLIRDPHELFGIAPTDEILFVFQSISAALAKSVDYMRFRAMIERCDYFQEEFKFRKDIASELQFPNRIIVRPVSGDSTAAIGQNVFGGCFPSTQQVLTSEGTLKTLGEVLNVQQNFFTIDELNCIIPSDTTRGVITGTKPFIKLKFDNGEEMVCTPDQKFKGVDNDWIIARDSIGRDFRFTTVQYMREQGHLLDSAFENGSSNVRERLQKIAPHGTSDRKEDDGTSADSEISGYGEDCLCGVPATPEDDRLEASSISQHDREGVHDKVSKPSNEDYCGEEILGREISCSCFDSASEPRIQENPTEGYCLSAVNCTCQNQGVDGKPRLQEDMLFTDEGTLGQEICSGDCRPHRQIGGREILLSGCRGADLQNEFEAGSNDSLLPGYDESNVGLRNSKTSLQGPRETQDVCSRLCTGDVLPGGEVNVCDRQGLQLESKDAECGHASSCSNPRNVEGSRSTSDVSVDGKELQETNAPLLRKDTCEILSIRCIEIVEGYLLDGTSYDIENIGGTHVFFAKMENGFLHAKNCIDEINYMAVTDKSKRHIDGGTYDQAIELYNSIARRRKSRFMKQGKLPGIFCLVSSKRYPGQFTDQKEEESKKEIEKNGKTTIYIYDKRTWDIKPETDFSGVWFNVFIGDETRRPRIMNEGETVHPDDRELVLQVPIEYEHEFEKDIINALREIGGISTLARFPFMMNREAITACFSDEVSGILSRDVCDFVTSYPDIIAKNFTNPHLPRWVHGDLSITGDSTGLVMGHVPYFMKVKRSETEIEMLPVIKIDFILEVVPPKGGEISYSAIRDLIYRVREAGLNVKWASFDSFQSQDMLHILRTKGFLTGIQSMDKEPTAYNFLKGALYDGRVEAPNNLKIRREILSLEKDPATGKVDHPVLGSKDLSDALAGVVHGLTMRREIWVMNNVPTVQLPQSIQAALPPKPVKEAMRGSEYSSLDAP